MKGMKKKEFIVSLGLALVLGGIIVLGFTGVFPYLIDQFSPGHYYAPDDYETVL